MKISVSKVDRPFDTIVVRVSSREVDASDKASIEVVAPNGTALQTQMAKFRETATPGLFLATAEFKHRLTPGAYKANAQVVTKESLEFHATPQFVPVQAKA